MYINLKIKYFHSQTIGPCIFGQLKPTTNEKKFFSFFPVNIVHFITKEKNKKINILYYIFYKIKQNHIKSHYLYNILKPFKIPQNILKKKIILKTLLKI